MKIHIKIQKQYIKKTHSKQTQNIPRSLTKKTMEIIILILNALQTFLKYFLTDQEIVHIPCLVVQLEAHSTLTWYDWKRQIYVTDLLCRKMV